MKETFEIPNHVFRAGMAVACMGFAYVLVGVIQYNTPILFKLMVGGFIFYWVEYLLFKYDYLFHDA